MPGVISIPKSYMGTTMPEWVLKQALVALNPEIHFDMGAALNLWHPYMQFRQNIYWRGNSVGAMDRGTLPECPIWTVSKDLVEIPWHEVKPGELAVFATRGVLCRCLKCKHEWEIPHRPVGNFECVNRTTCGNSGPSTDPDLWAWDDNPAGTAWVYREVRDQIILVGWRHTLSKVLRANIPGVTREALEEKLGVTIQPKEIDPLEVPELKAEHFTHSGLEILA